MDPFHQDRAVRQLASVHGIAYMAYSSLGTQWERRGRNPVMESHVLRQVDWYTHN
jgi:diketogulonate reductase-like aldo/keto reductase